MVKEETYSSLRFTGSGVRPCEITQHLNLLPSRAWQKGEWFSDAIGNKRRRYNGLWLYDAKGMTFRRPISHVAHLMNLVGKRIVTWRKEHCHRNVRVDLGLWVVAPEISGTIFGKYIDSIIECGYDGLNISFVGVGNCLSSRRARHTRHSFHDAKEKLRLYACGFNGAECSVLLNGKAAWYMDNAMTVFSKTLQRKKNRAKTFAVKRILVEWHVGHGILYISRRALKLFRGIGCTRIDFILKNV